MSNAEMAKQAGSWARRGQHEMDTVHLVKCKIDEAALLFSDPGQLNEWLTWAKGQGYEHIGSIERDHMRCRNLWSPAGLNMAPHHSPGFQVRFEFLHLEGFPFRIEAMCVLSGDAPLHERVLAKYGEGAVVHLSWRAAPNGDADGYMRHRLVLQDSAHMKPMAEYENSYGRFCYYGEIDKPPFLKPRVNLRDQ